MGNSMTKKRAKNKNVSREGREKTLQSWEFYEAKPQTAEDMKPKVGADTTEAENVVLKSVLKRREQASSSSGRRWRRSFKYVRKDVRFNLAEVEITEGDPMSPPLPGYGIKFLGCVWPGKDVEKDEDSERARETVAQRVTVNEESVGV